MPVNIVSIISEEVSNLDIGTGIPPLFIHGTKSFQNLKSDGSDLTNGMVYLDEPIRSRDTSNSSGSFTEHFILTMFFAQRVFAPDMFEFDKQNTACVAMRRLYFQFINALKRRSEIDLIDNNIDATNVLNFFDSNLSGVTVTIAIDCTSGESVCPVIATSSLNILTDAPYPNSLRLTLATTGASGNGEKAIDTDWIEKVAPYNPDAVEEITGTHTQYALYKSDDGGAETEYNGPPHGNNIPGSELALRSPVQVLADVPGGPDNDAAFGFFEDAVGYTPLISKGAMVIPINMIRPRLLGNNVITNAEIDHAVTVCNDAGIEITCIQLGYEAGNSTNADVYPDAEIILNVQHNAKSYINGAYPDIDVSLDGTNWDDENPTYPSLNLMLKDLIDSQTLVRQYAQLDQINETTYLLARQKMNPGLATMIDWCEGEDQFGPDVRIRLAQTTFKDGNPLRYTFAEGLIYLERDITALKLNQTTGDKIAEIVQFNVSRFVSGTGFKYPCYDLMVLMRFVTDGGFIVEVDYTGPGSNDLEIIGKMDDDGNIAVAILNPTGNVIVIPSAAIMGLTGGVTVESYYTTDPASTTSLHYADSGTAIICKPWSGTKVTVTPLTT